MNRHCGICHEKTNKEFCWRCQEHSNRMGRSIAKKLQAVKKYIVKIKDVDQISELLKYGEITYVSHMTNVVFLNTELSNVKEIKNLPNVIRISEERTGSLDV